jgi:hypothetical protein
MHGSFGRGDTFNNMAAIGPDFKQGYVDYAPVSNADVTPTLARILGLQLPSTGNLKGRPITEALVGGPDKVSYTTGTLTSPAANGQSTILNYQTVGDAKYFTAAGFKGATVGLTTSAPGVVFGQNNSLTLDNGFGSLLFTLTPTNKSNEIGVFLVDDDKGTINDIAAGNTKEYIQTALKRSQTLFSALPGDDVLQVTKQSQQRQLSFPQGAKLGFYSVANDTSNKVLSDLASGVTPDKTASIFFNFNGANRDGSNHIKVDNLGNSTFQLNWDNGSVFKVQAQASNVQTNVDAGALNILIDSGATSQVTPIQLVVNSEAAYNDFVGYYRVSDASGTVIDNGKTYKPGDAGYASAAIRQASQDLGLSNGSNLNSSGRSTNSKNANLTGGSLYAPLLIANGDIQSFLGKNANNDPNNANNPLAYFAYVNANPDKVDHIRGIGGNTIGFEDLFGGGDRDFNDIVLQLNASKPLVTSAIAI